LRRSVTQTKIPTIFHSSTERNRAGGRL